MTPKLTFTERFNHAWNAFLNPISNPGGSYVDPNAYAQRRWAPRTQASTFSASIYNKIAIDVAMTTFQHIREDKKTEDIRIIESGLNYCLNTEANVDQSGISFIHDIAYSLLDEGSVAVVPIDTTISPSIAGSFDIQTMRTGKILEFRTGHVKVKLYNDQTGRNEELWLPKKMVAIIENPLYAVVNEPNSTLQRLLTKMNLVDNFEAMVTSGKLDLLIQLPHAVRTDKQVEQAVERIQRIEKQLEKGSHGISYIDGTEKVVQLNRPANNQLIESINILTEQFYNQIGLTPKVFDGTANESEMRNYYNRTIDPIVSFIVAELERKLLTKTARTQGHKIQAYRNNFKLVPVEQIINLGDTFRRNQIATSNEIRKLVGFKVSNDPLADQLSNPNIADKNQTPEKKALLKTGEQMKEEPQTLEEKLEAKEIANEERREQRNKKL